MTKPVYVFTCEHASAQLPKAFERLISSYWLRTHRGVDIGARDLYDYLHRVIPSYAKKARYSRLLIDLNRSVDNPQLFSDPISALAVTVRQEIIRRYYRPYREAIEEHIQKQITKQQAVQHFSIHSYCPVLCGKKREVVVGLLFDPARPAEHQLCLKIKNVLEAALDLAVKLNYPYAGTDDGFTTYLRKRFSKRYYFGIEIEVCQPLLHKTAKHKSALFEALAYAIKCAA